MKKGKFKVDIYEVIVNVIIVEDTKKTTEFYFKLHKQLKIKTSEDHSGCEGFALVHGLRAWIVLAEDCLTVQTITHEVSHLTFQIFNFNAVEEGKDNEHFALLNGFLNSKVFKTINRLGCKIK